MSNKVRRSDLINMSLSEKPISDVLPEVHYHIYDGPLKEVLAKVWRNICAEIARARHE